MLATIACEIDISAKSFRAQSARITMADLASPGRPWLDLCDLIRHGTASGLQQRNLFAGRVAEVDRILQRRDSDSCQGQQLVSDGGVQCEDFRCGWQ